MRRGSSTIASEERVEPREPSIESSRWDMVPALSESDRIPELLAEHIPQLVFCPADLDLRTHNLDHG